LIHHSDADSQHTSISFAETLVLEGIAAAIGSVGDAYDNALTESTIGLLKDRSDFQEQSVSARARSRQSTTSNSWAMEWVDWSNARCLHSTLDYVPPD
jgi:transposase InsO family protein